ncbi:FYVE and coiled-coil domain-containing protein 1-like isoform X3 [Portunus trituberculatus]|uniref:FYVE and coiled-coil domain-containing protein 1-like isoform X3 n=1 Tax=Portunus trituberculatus TaxID=210409 RepID=UPI001E1CE752|nr:FYVE and coiled-coil domain-containing protein 1-like isoform X3 [Portunus trituberculatus]XP_045126074.1 FYVE and coiled-coil domain-containing protein 1-like isoform X3 [Portunus trituberculatus]
MASNKKPVGVNFEKILQSLQGDVQEMKTEYDETCLPINDDNKHLHQFCDRLEFIFNFNMIEGSSFLSGRKDVWQYFCKCLANRRNIHDGLKIVKANTELKTSIGRFRCFVRYCLVHQCLGDVAQQCVDNKNITRQFYQEGALTLNLQLLPTLLGCLYQLCDIPFDLPPSGHDLDVSWPTFTRLGAAGGWRPPSRTMSLSSLYSHVSQLSEAVGIQSPNSPTMAPVGEDDPQGIIDSALAMEENTSEVAVLNQRLISLEQDNDMLRASCSALQSQLDQVKSTDAVVPSTGMGENSQVISSANDRCHQCELLTEELRVTKSQNEDLENLRRQLEEQVCSLQLQQDQFEAQEKDLNSEIKCLQEKLNQAHIASRTLDSCVSGVTETDNVPDLPVVTVGSEKTQVPDSDGSESHVATDSTVSAQESLEQCQSMLRELEKENKLLQEQCNAAEVEKTMLRTNIRKVSANWFERKTRLSDSDSESHLGGEGLSVHQDFSCSKNEIGVQVPDFVPEKCSLFKKMEDVPNLLAELSYTTDKLDLTERMCSELKRRVKEYENVIDDQEVVIHGLKDQLDTYFNDNRKMSEQLRTLNKLFEDLELTEKRKVNNVNPPDTISTVFSSLPSEEDFKEMSHSVSKTYTKLKELIMEKKSLVTEIERLKVLNVELQRRVSQQENRLLSVSDALHSTWLLVSDMKEQHAQLHASESILRYELKDKKELLHRLREELECSREQWHKIRKMNSESEEAWNSLREELNERRRKANEVVSPDSEGKEKEEIEGATAVVQPSDEFEPPVDLLLDMAIEYGIIDADDDASTAMVAAMEGEDMHASRLEDLEDQCSYLYQKLMASTARSLTLASRLTALHQHYGSSDEDEDEEDEDDDDDDMDDEYDNHDYEELDNNDIHNFDSEILSPEPESSDTAYMSEADTGSAASGLAGNLSEEEGATAAGSADEAFTAMEEATDVEGDLSKRLINFLPKKIEILNQENKKLQERCRLLQEEKTASETHLTEMLEREQNLRRVLEAKLEHLGKIVDELKLERNGKISEVEEELKQKVASLNQQEQEYECLKEEVDTLKEQLEERGNLLHIASSRVTELESTLKVHEKSSEETFNCLKQAEEQVKELQITHSKQNQEHEKMKKEIETLTVQLADLRFQVSSKDMECDAAIKADQEKTEALTAAALQINEQEAKINHLEQQATTDKKAWQNEVENLLSRETKLQEDIKERNLHCSSIEERLLQAEAKLKVTQNTLTETQGELKSTQDNSTQLSSDNEQLREKILQLLSKRVRVCDDCFSVQAELAAIVATVANTTSSWHGSDETSEQSATGVQASSSAKSLPITNRQPNDDDFAVISDDEVQSSRLSSSPSSGSPPSNPEVVPETRATADILTFSSLSSQPPTDFEAWVGAGSRSLVPVELPAGVTLQWNFVSEPKCISFSVLHQPPPLNNQEPGDEGVSVSQRVLIPTTRVASTQGSSVRGRLVTKQPGVYTLVFDNASSRYTAKKITYSLRLLKQSGEDSMSQHPSSSSVSHPSP